MNVVDSSAWLEYFAGGPNAGHFAAAIEGTDELMVPTLVLLEVFKRIAQQRDDSTALQYVAVMKQGSVVDLDADLALAAAEVGLRHKLPLADSVVYATARRAGATVWTQDADFEGRAGVRFWAKRA